MNPFTKEELKLMQDNLHWNEKTETNFLLIGLNKKLKALIDNYDKKETLTEEQINLAHEDDYIPAPDFDLINFDVKN